MNSFKSINNNNDEYFAFSISKTSSNLNEISNIVVIINNDTQNSKNDIIKKNNNNVTNNVFKNASDENFKTVKSDFNQFFNIRQQTRPFIKKKKAFFQSFQSKMSGG